MPQRPWYRISNKTGGNAEIDLYGDIGKGGFFADDNAVSAKSFLDELRGIKADTITLRINSPGGDVFDGLAIYNSLVAHPAKIHVKVDGLAASIASVIAMAGDTVEMPENALMMIHNPSTLAWGDMHELRKTANVLDKAKDSLLLIYANKTKLDPAELAQMLDAETWLNGNDALRLGFADEVTDAVKITARFDPKRFKHPPISNHSTEAVAMSEPTAPQLSWEELDANLEQRISAALQQQTAIFSSSMGEINAKYTALVDKLAAEFSAFKRETEAKTADELCRLDAINGLFSMFDGPQDKPYEAHYLRLKAECLGNPSVNEAQARARVADLRQQFSAFPPQSSLSGAVDSGAQPPQTKDFSALVEAHMQQHGVSKAKAIQVVAVEHPTEHAAWLKKINDR